MAASEKDGSVTEDTELKVTDRRFFTATGDLRPEAVAEAEQAQVDPPPEPTRTEPPVERAPESGSGEEAGFVRRPVEEPEGVDFTMLINAMAEPALIFLGEIAHPGTGEPQVDLERAKLQIDMLDLLRIKSRGNMTPEEEGLLDRILYQLRMLYVARANKPQA